MTTCKDCKHWGTGKRQREWESARDGYNSHDASRYQADLWTAPEFGCTLWEESVQPPEGP